MDLEGEELLALRGFTKHLAAPEGPIVLCEVTNRFLQELGGSAAELVSMMVGLGYAVYTCENMRFEPVPAGELEKPNDNNHIFIKKTNDLGALPHDSGLR